MRVENITSRIGLATMLAFCSASQRASAQRLTVGLGLGQGIDAHSAPTSAKNTNTLAFLQLQLPVVPAIRAELVGVHGDPFAHDISLVQPLLSLPVTPYAIAGLGRYGLSGDVKEGWNFGVGARYIFREDRAPGPRGVFIELRRHQRLDHDLLTAGVTIQLGNG